MENRMANLISRKYLPFCFCEDDLEISECNNCVYFITDGRYTKIGIATNLIKRLSSLQTSNPRKLKPLCAIICENKQEMQKYEMMLHKIFDAKRRNGEWFLISENDIEKSKRLLNVKMFKVI